MAYTAGFSVSVGDPTKASDVSVLAANDDYLKAAVEAKATLSGDTNNTVTTVTAANALIGEADLTFDGSTLAVTGALSATGNVSFDGGSFVFNEAGADKDFRIEGDTEANLFVADASTDRIGIGTATPSSTLDVVGVGQFGNATGYLYIGNLGKSLSWNRNPATGAISNASAHAYQWQQTTSATPASDYLAVQVYDEAGSEVTANAFVINGDGKVGIGTATPSHLLDVEGYINANSGIQFNGDTDAANALDDYEEGTWTPLLGAHAVNGTHTYTFQVGTYTKIGNQVSLMGRVTINTLNSSGPAISGNLEMRGIPYTSATVTGSYIVGSFRPVGLDMDGSVGPTCMIGSNRAVVDFGAAVDDASYDTFTSEDVASGDEFWFAITYFV